MASSLLLSIEQHSRNVCGEPTDCDFVLTEVFVLRTTALLRLLDAHGDVVNVSSKNSVTVQKTRRRDYRKSTDSRCSIVETN